MKDARLRSMGGVTGLLILLVTAGCTDGALGGVFARGDSDPATRAATTTRLVERDIEAPEVFQVTEPGLWDGRPSLGGVWVAHPDVGDPERVIIRNEASGKFVIGALFRRERDNPGPSIQVSSDAADALGMLAGAPATLNVTALRREEAADPALADPALADPALADPAMADPALADPALAEATEADAMAAPDALTNALIASGPISGSPVTAAALQAEPGPGFASPAAAVPIRVAATPSDLSEPFLHVGNFSEESNANTAATALRKAGLAPQVKRQSSKGKAFWRVLVGPVAATADRDAALRQVQDLGFADAYAIVG